jgi:hypothetical protein
MTLGDEYLGLVAETRGFAQLPNDWDGEGAITPTRASLGNTLRLLESLCETLPDLPAPDMGPCANGSVDLYWKEPEFTLLMNVHDSDFSWYGEKSDFKTKGTIADNLPDFDFIRELTSSSGDLKP